MQFYYLFLLHYFKFFVLSSELYSCKYCCCVYLQIKIAALRIAADKFDPDFIEKRKAALEVSMSGVEVVGFVIQ